MMIYTVYCCSGSVSHPVLENVDYDDALTFCVEHDWEYDYNGGLVWDLMIDGKTIE